MYSNSIYAHFSILVRHGERPRRGYLENTIHGEPLRIGRNALAGAGRFELPNHGVKDHCLDRLAIPQYESGEN